MSLPRHSEAVRLRPDGVKAFAAMRLGAGRAPLAREGAM
jgi:hypothetical protein